MTLIDEYQPPQSLSGYIQSYWQGNFNIAGERKISHSVLPTGCIELIIHLSNHRCLLSADSQDWQPSPTFTLLGLFEKPYTVQFEKPVDVFGIRFYPDGIRQTFGVPPAEFLSTYDDCVSVLGNTLDTFFSKIKAAKDCNSRIDISNQFLQHELSKRKMKYDYTHLAMTLARRSSGLTTYQELVKQIPISPRQLQREFQKIYGISVRDYLRLTRINAIYRYMLSGNIDLSQLPYQMEFFDQSHFIKEFKIYSGVPPKKFLKAKETFIVNPT